MEKEKLSTTKEDQIANAAIVQLGVMQNISAVVGRSEALSIFVNILNAMIDAQSQGSNLTQALQSAIDKENETTQVAFKALHDQLQGKSANTD